MTSVQFRNRCDIESFFVALDHDIKVACHIPHRLKPVPPKQAPIKAAQTLACVYSGYWLLATGYWLLQLFATSSFLSFSRCSFRIAFRLSLILLPSSARTFTRI